MNKWINKVFFIVSLSVQISAASIANTINEQKLRCQFLLTTSSCSPKENKVKVFLSELHKMSLQPIMHQGKRATFMY